MAGSPSPPPAAVPAQAAAPPGGATLPPWDQAHLWGRSRRCCLPCCCRCWGRSRRSRCLQGGHGGHGCGHGVLSWPPPQASRAGGHGAGPARRRCPAPRTLEGGLGARGAGRDGDGQGQRGRVVGGQELGGLGAAQPLKLDLRRGEAGGSGRWQVGGRQLRVPSWDGMRAAQFWAGWRAQPRRRPAARCSSPSPAAAVHPPPPTCSRYDCEMFPLSCSCVKLAVPRTASSSRPRELMLAASASAAGAAGRRQPRLGGAARRQCDGADRPRAP